jgi:hypothetical protein
MAAYYLIQTVIWVRGILSEIGMPRTKPTPIHLDSQSAIQTAQNPVHHQRTKHIEIKFHIFRQRVSDNTINAHFVPSRDQLADILTKAQDTMLFQEQCVLIMVDVRLYQTISYHR